MLLKFTVGNFLSFKDRATLDMTAEGLKEKKGNLHVPYLYNPKLLLLKSMAVYGFNAFGKSNLLKAYAFFQRFIFTSFSLGKMAEDIGTEPFMLSTSTVDMPSYFEIVFILKKTKYRYGFEVTNRRVVSEWLYYADGTVRENMLFIRSGQEFRDVSKQWNREAANMAEQAIMFTKPANLFLSVLLSQDNVPRVEGIAQWLKGNIVLTANYGSQVNKGAAQIYSDIRYRDTILKFLENEALGFKTVFDKIANALEKGIHSDLVDVWFEIERKNFELFTHHKVVDENHAFQKVIEFNLQKNESSGSVKYFIVACFLAHALHNGQLIWIDELDASLDTQIFSFLIKVFNDPRNNAAGSQMIFITHNTVLLDRRLRRDQILLVDKNEHGESSLHKAHSAKNPVRIDKLIEQEYREGNLEKGMTKQNMNDLPNLFNNQEPTEGNI